MRAKEAIIRRSGLVLVVLGIAAAAPPLHGRETPTSYGRAANVDTPILRIPKRPEPPTIDGKIGPKEWENASALSSFWYDYSGNADFRFLAPDETQVEVYAAYDNEHLYLAVTSAVYPRGSWLRARGRFPDVLNHPQYGILNDDHIELELRPHEDLSEGFQHGLLRFDVNPTGTVADWYFSPKHGTDFQWTSNAKIRSHVTDERWTVEYKIPFKSMRYKGYAKKGEDGQPLVSIPPKPGTVIRSWFVRGIGGNGVYFNVFDKHPWNTTKTKLILDPEAPSFQINELGPIMKDRIDMKLTVKNHSDQSKTLLIGFFVENASETIYSTYNSEKLNEGLLELTPGEKRTLRLKKQFPGISKNGNVLWFDVRAAGNPAKQLFRTRLVRFHSMQGGSVTKTKKIRGPGGKVKKTVKKEVSFRERRLERIETLRPEKKKFLFRWSFSSFTRDEGTVVAHDKKLSAVVDTGIRSATKEVKRAVEAKLMCVETGPSGRVIAKSRGEFRGDFAQIDMKAPDLAEGGKYRLSVLLFDKNKRIVGERQSEPFRFKEPEWEGHDIGTSDVVWEPFESMEVTDDGFRTLKHAFSLTDAGLPAQIRIRPDRRDIPLEKRSEGASLSDRRLRAMGHGPQLQKPVHLVAEVDGTRHRAEVVEPAKLVRKWKSELVYESRLRAGPITIDMKTRYDCDGSLHCEFSYGSERPVTVQSLELVWPTAGPVTMVAPATDDAGMQGADKWNTTLPQKSGVVWDSSGTNMPLFEGKFVPVLWFGNGDRGWTWYCDSDEGWMLDEEGASMRLVRGKDGSVTWRVSFVNHESELSKERSIRFHVLTHPAKPKPKDFREMAWHYFVGRGWATGYNQEPIDLSKEYLKKRWHRAAGAPEDIPWKKAETFRKDDPPWKRYGQWRNVGVSPALDQTWEEKATFYFERHIRVGRRVGWWMDEYWPPKRSNNIAAGHAYMRPREEVDQAKELPYQSEFLTEHMRGHYKRLARVFKKNNVPQRQHTWANKASTVLESFIYNCALVEGAAGWNRSYELDNVAQYPSSLYRYLAKGYTGLFATALYDETPITPGDDPRLDRQILGRALLHDIGASPSGPHGVIQNPIHGVRLLRVMRRFGLFKETGTEVLPYWRTGELIRMKGSPGASGDLYVTVYRRRIEDGKGVKALIVIMNERDEPVSLPLEVLEPDRIFGGRNTVTVGEIRGKQQVAEELAGWWQRARDRRSARPALRDAETGAPVLAKKGADNRYGPVHVPYHDFRVLYGRHAPGEGG